MSQSPLSTERRHARSNDTLVSLSRLLEAARRESGLHAVALADASGFLVAGSGAARLCEELAAVSALPGSEWPLFELEAESRNQVPVVRKLLIDGLEVTVSALGIAKATDYARLDDGCRRILSERVTGRVAAH